MNSQHHDQPELTAAQEAAVRAALADAGDVGPMPVEVADRLDAVVEDLVAERADATTEATTDPDHEVSVGSLPADHPEAAVVRPLDPAARRRRTQVRVLLGAAAAVVVVGLGAGVIGGGQGGDDLGASSSLASDSPDRDESGDAGGATLEDAGAADELSAPADSEEASRAAGLDSAAETVPPSAPNLTLERLNDLSDADGPVREIRSEHLREDLVALQHLSLPDPTGAAADYSGAVLIAPPSFVCPSASYGAGLLVGVSYDGRPVVVSFHEPVGRTQEAEVLACGTADVLHSTTLPVG